MTCAQGRNPLFGRLARDERGAAAVEFALWAVVLIPIVASATDLGFYVFQSLQVKQAAQMAAQTVWRTCSSATNPAYVPAVQNCPGLAAMLNTAIQNNTGLGAAVTLSTSNSDEGYYCVNDSGVLTPLTRVQIPTSGAATLSSPYTKCSDAGAAYANNSAAPGDYVEVSVTYPYTPLFGGASIGALLPTPIIGTAWTRLN